MNKERIMKVNFYELIKIFDPDIKPSDERGIKNTIFSVRPHVDKDIAHHLLQNLSEYQDCKSKGEVYFGWLGNQPPTMEQLDITSEFVEERLNREVGKTRSEVEEQIPQLVNDQLKAIQEKQEQINKEFAEYASESVRLANRDSNTPRKPRGR